MGAMLEMMQRMMGQKPGGEGDKPGKGSGSKGGEGQTGDSNAANSATTTGSAQPVGERKVPKSAGSAGADLPLEFTKALDAYNRPASR